MDDEEAVEGGGGRGRETYGSMLTGVASLMAESTGGVMSQLSIRATQKEHTDYTQDKATLWQRNIPLNTKSV